MVNEEMEACLKEMADADGYIHRHPLDFWFTTVKRDDNFHWSHETVKQLEKEGLVEWCSFPVPGNPNFHPRGAMITSKGLELV